MTDKPQPSSIPITGIIVIALLGIGGFVLMTAGAFNKLEFKAPVKPEPFTAIIVHHQGNYPDIQPKIVALSQYLKENEITPAQQIAVFYYDPQQTSRQSLECAGGFILTNNIQNINSGEYTITNIQLNTAAVYSFSGHPIIGTQKGRQQIKKWCIQNNYTVTGRSVERYEIKGNSIIITSYNPVIPITSAD